MLIASLLEAHIKFLPFSLSKAGSHEDGMEEVKHVCVCGGGGKSHFVYVNTPMNLWRSERERASEKCAFKNGRHAKGE
jgi:hypothetical protein